MFEQTLKKARKWILWILEGVHSKEKKVQQQRTGVEAHFAQSGRPAWLGRREWEGKWGVRQSSHWDWKEWRLCRDLEIFGLLLWMKWEALDRLHRDVTGWVFQWSSSWELTNGVWGWKPGDQIREHWICNMDLKPFSLSFNSEIYSRSIIEPWAGNY